VPAKVGATQRCTLTALDGTTIGVTATVTAVNGDDVSFDFKVDDEPQ
jgi:predicted thioesterase